jgi:HEAT repeat protein
LTQIAQIVTLNLTAEISDIRCYSAISLGQLGASAAVNGLIEALNDKDHPNVRKAAAQALRMIGAP